MPTHIFAQMTLQTQTLIGLAVSLLGACLAIAYLATLIFQLEWKPWRVVARWRAVKGIQREIDDMNREAPLSVSHGVEQERRLRLVVTGSSRRVS